MMFHSLQLDQAVDRKTFREASLPLRTQLLEAQFALHAAGKRVLIIIAGVPGAGRGSLVHRCNEWLDARGVSTSAFWDHSDEEEERPYPWRFWRALPARGRIGIFFGSWYSRPLRARALEQIDDNAFDAEMHRIAELERALAVDGLVIVKLWLHISADYQRAQLERSLAPDQLNLILPADQGALRDRYPQLLQAAERMIVLTDRQPCTWHLVAAEDAYHRDLSVGRYLLAQMTAALQEDTSTQHTAGAQADTGSSGGKSSNGKRNDKAKKSRRIEDIPATVLDMVKLSEEMTAEAYDTRLALLQKNLHELAWQARSTKVSLLLVFEGWDAAGKGSAIRRVTQSMDPRLFSLYQIGAPSDQERAQHYLWRFWRSLPRDGRITIFDRSWYGRVLVERVENLATEAEWQRAYAEINHFEGDIARHGASLLKFWLHISPEEQWRRFEERANTPHKHYKITDDDWRNRGRWPDYALAVDEMVRRTSTEAAPWTLIPGNDKRFARIAVLEAVCTHLAAAIARTEERHATAPPSVRVLT